MAHGWNSRSFQVAPRDAWSERRSRASRGAVGAAAESPASVRNIIKIYDIPGEPKFSDYLVFIITLKPYHNLITLKLRVKSINQKQCDRRIHGNLFGDSPDCFHVEVCPA